MAELAACPAGRAPARDGSGSATGPGRRRRRCSLDQPDLAAGSARTRVSSSARNSPNSSPVSSWSSQPLFSSASSHSSLSCMSTTSSIRSSRAVVAHAGPGHHAAPVGHLDVEARTPAASGRRAPGRSAPGWRRPARAGRRTAPAARSRPMPEMPAATWPPRSADSDSPPPEYGDVVDLPRVDAGGLRQQPGQDLVGAAGRAARDRRARPGRPSRRRRSPRCRRRARPPARRSARSRRSAGRSGVMSSSGSSESLVSTAPTMTRPIIISSASSSSRASWPRPMTPPAPSTLKTCTLRARPAALDDPLHDAGGGVPAAAGAGGRHDRAAGRGHRAARPCRRTRPAWSAPAPRPSGEEGPSRTGARRRTPSEAGCDVGHSFLLRGRRRHPAVRRCTRTEPAGRRPRAVPRQGPWDRGKRGTDAAAAVPTGLHRGQRPAPAHRRRAGWPVA